MPNTIRHAAVYARVSTTQQVDEGTSLDDRVTRLHARATADGHEDVVEYIDAGRSGASMEREALNDLLLACDRGEVAVVYATKIDRIARRMLSLLTIHERLLDNDVGLVVLDEGMDTTKPTGTMVM